MQSQQESVSLLRDYLGFDQRRLLTFLGLVLGVVLVVTLLYVAIFGFDTWSNNMHQAGHLMLANADPRALAGPGGPQVGPGNMRYRPVATAMGGPLSGAVLPAAPTGAQYVCPRCGLGGLPRWTAGGAPQCPACGGIMNFAGGPVVAAQTVARP